MSKRLEGGFLGSRPTWSTAASSGVWSMEQLLARIAAGTWPSPSALYDPYFESVGLLLHMNGSNGSTTFVDSSLGNLAVTASGNAQISTAQSMFGGSSGLFDGNGDYLTLADSSIWDLSGDFTIEAWVKASATGFGPIFSTRNTGAAVNPVLYLWDTGVLAWYYNTAARITGTTNIVGGNFYHVAVCRSGGLTRLFVNGVQEGATYANSDAYVADGIWIGSIPASSQHFNGYIDELRITRGVARYTANFGVPGNPGSDEGPALYDPYFDYVSLLLRCNGENNSTTFTDSSNNALAITRNGDAKISTTQARFGGASAYFDGTGDYLSVARNNAFLPVANEDFTFEAWIYMTATPGATGAQIMGLGEYGTDSDWIIAINSSRQCYFYTNSNTTAYTNTTTIALNTWTHVAVSRSGTAASNLNVFINGVGQSFSNNVTTIASGNRNLTIGADQNGDESNFTGYIDDLRITKGVGRYTTNFRPVGPYATSGKLVDPYLTSTSLLLPMTGDNGNTSFFDRSNNFLRATEIGNTKVSTTQSKFGETSAYFDGTGDYLSITTSSALAYGTGDFTIEMWLYRSGSGQQHLYEGRRTTATGRVLLYLNASTQLTFYVNGVAVIATTSVPTLNAWAHIAVARSAGTTRMFLDGVQIGSSYADSNNYLAPSDFLCIGCNDALTGAFFNGYIDDLRVTKGAARYVTTFTPPERAFNDEAFNDPYYNNVSLLLHMDGTNNSTTFTDSSPLGLPVTANANAKISTAQSRFGSSSGVFDGTGDYLSQATRTDLALGTGDFTIETWVYLNSYTNFSFWESSPIGSAVSRATGFIWYMVANGTMYLYHNTVNLITTSTAIFPLFTWTHVACCRSSGTTRLFVNGISVGSTSTTITDTAGGRVIGAFCDDASLSPNGYLDEFRITKGVARYTSNFTPPTLPFYNTTIPTVDTSFSSVSLLLHMNGTNGSTTFTDSSSNALAVTANGNAQISTAQSKFGGASGLFDGNGDFLAIPNNTVFAFGTGDFTIEFWFYPISVADGTMISGWSPSGSVSGFACNMSSGAVAFETAFNNTYISAAGPATITANQWYHFAGVRSNGVARAFINGSSGTPTNNSQSVDAQSSGVNIGWSTFTANRRAYNGYIDDLRITKGVARYTSNFYIPRAAFPDA